MYTLYMLNQILMLLSSFFFFFFLQETHIMHNYSENFYGSWLRLSICGYIRPEQDFTSLGNKSYPLPNLKMAFSLKH